jgi:acyl dehydratase
MTQATRIHPELPSNGPLFLRALFARKEPFHRGAQLPDLAEAIEEVSFAPKRLARYVELCGFTPGDTLPITAPHVLAAPLHTALLTRPEFPIKALGLIHVSNRVLQHRAIPTNAPLAIHVGMGHANWVPKGVEFNLMTTVRVDKELAWEEVSTIFWRGEEDPSAKKAAPRTAQYQTMSPTLEETWELPGDLGRRYASVSGDYNPIHLWPWSARIFGFKRPIIHGMWSLARAASALEAQLRGDEASIDIHFRRPIFVPQTVAFEAQQSSGICSFAAMTPEKGLCFSGQAQASIS